MSILNLLYYYLKLEPLLHFNPTNKVYCSLVLLFWGLCLVACVLVRLILFIYLNRHVCIYLRSNFVEDNLCIQLGPKLRRLNPQKGIAFAFASSRTKEEDKTSLLSIKFILHLGFFCAVIALPSSFAPGMLSLFVLLTAYWLTEQQQLFTPPY